MPVITFFIQKHCDRCFRDLGKERTLSFPSGEVLCLDCSGDGEESCRVIRKQGVMVDACQEAELATGQEEIQPKK